MNHHAQLSCQSPEDQIQDLMHAWQVHDGRSLLVSPAREAGFQMAYFFGLICGAPAPIFSTLNDSRGYIQFIRRTLSTPAAQSQWLMLLKMIISFILSSLSCQLAQALLWLLLEGNLMSPRPPPHSAPLEPHSTVLVCANFLSQSDLILHIGMGGGMW